MERFLEPELMNDEAQAAAYAAFDFREPNSNFIKFFIKLYGDSRFRRPVLDLGCGPADIAVRFARIFPQCVIHAVDGSQVMLNEGRKALQGAADVGEQVELIHGVLPNVTLPNKRYDVVMSNSLLHHLHHPDVLWDTVKKYAASDARILMMDLKRPETQDQAGKLVETYAAGGAEILKRDFYNSLLAAFTINEVREQLKGAGLGYLSIMNVTELHLAVFGHIRK